MKVFTPPLITLRPSRLRCLFISAALLATLLTTGCVSKQECERRVSEAVETERATWSAIVEDLREENKNQKAEYAAEISRLTAQVHEARVQAAIVNHRRGALGLTVDAYQGFTAPSIVSQILFWLGIVLTLGALMALGIWLIRDTSLLNEWSKVLVIPLAVYISLRFTFALTGEGFRLASVHEWAMEPAGLLAGLACTWLVDVYRQTHRRLVVDLLGVAVGVFATMSILELVLFNRELLMASGPSFALRLVACPLLGAAIYGISKAVRTSARRKFVSNNDSDEETDSEASERSWRGRRVSSLFDN